MAYGLNASSCNPLSHKFQSATQYKKIQSFWNLAFLLTPKNDLSIKLIHVLSVTLTSLINYHFDG